MFMIEWKVVKGYSRTSFLIILTFGLIFTGKAWAADPARVTVNMTEPQKLVLTVGKSIILDISNLVKRVSLAEPGIADALILTPRQIYLTGKSPGVTNLTLWRSEGEVSNIFDIDVMPDVNRLKAKLHTMFPDEEDIRVTATHDSLSLSGTVSSTARLAEVLTLARSYAPKVEGGKPTVNDLLTVAGVHQVMLEVRISEMSRSLVKKLGINFNVISANGMEFGLSALDNLSSLRSLSALEDFRGKSLGLSSSINAIFRFYDGGVPWTFLIDALKDQGLLKTLAEPTLITLSGKAANFLAGGEFPIPVPSQDGIGIEYKPFGVGLNFTPTVLSKGRINIEVAPEVSSLDFANALSYAGFVIPSLTTRRVSTVIELGDGQSFAIAGLLRDEVREFVRKFPLLGDIPILGSMFRSSSFQKNETELIIIVTPHLVKPLDMNRQTLPTDEYIEPDDFEFYLLGSMEGKEDIPLLATGLSPWVLDTTTAGGGLDGDFGHIQP